MSFVCHSYVPLCHSYVLVCYPYVTRMYSYVIRMYSYVIRMSLLCTRMSSVCHSYVTAVTEPIERAFGEQADFLDVFYQSKVISIVSATTYIFIILSICLRS